jgi:hypothetical protein
VKDVEYVDDGRGGGLGGAKDLKRLTKYLKCVLQKILKCLWGRLARSSTRIF